MDAKLKSGYILFSAETRKRLMQENPDAGFVETSRLISVEWMKLSDEQMLQYEARAQIMVEEREKNKLLQSFREILLPGQIRIFCCSWEKCDFQCGSDEGLIEHTKYHAGQVGEYKFLASLNVRNA